MKALWLNLLLLSWLVNACGAFTLSCTFATLTPYYHCSSSTSISSENQKVSSVSGTHTSGYSNNNVTSITLTGTYIYYMPMGVDAYFPNIEQLSFTPPWVSYTVYNGFKSLSKNDLKQFPKLKRLTIYYGSISFIDSDVFDHTPNLEYIYFYYNLLSHVGPGFLDSLKKLTTFHMNNPSYCDFTGSADISAVKNHVATNCKPTVEMTQRDLRKVKIEAETLREENAKLVRERNALTINLSETSRKLMATEKTAEGLRKLLTNNRDSRQDKCTASQCELERDQCKAELSILQDFRRETTAVTITCATSSEDICTADLLEVHYKQSEIKAVVNKDQTKIASEKVRKLIIDNQLMLYLPSNLATHFPNLTHLSVINSRLMEVSDTDFVGMVHLESLSLMKNVITEINDETLAPLENLKTLDLSWNKIDKVDVNAFRTLTNLTEIKLNDNLLKELKGSTFVMQKNLKNLELQNNELKFIGTTLLHSLKSVEKVDLANNVCINMTHPPNHVPSMTETIATVCAPPAILCCKFSNELSNQQEQSAGYTCQSSNFVVENPMTKLVAVKTNKECADNVENDKTETNSKDVSILAIEQSNMLYMPEKVSNFFPILTKLFVFNSGLSAIEKNNFVGMSKLLILKFTGNDIKFIAGDAFDEITQLVILDLSNNKIKTLPENVITKLMKLKTLNFANNDLTQLGMGSRFFPIGNVIEDINFANNPIHEMHRRLLNDMNNLKVANFKNNKCVDAVHPKEITYYELRVDIALKC